MSYDYSFHQRVRDTIIECARSYKRIFLDYEYLLCSEAFQVHDYYIIDAREDNYKHLTGVNSSLKAIWRLRRTLKKIASGVHLRSQKISARWDSMLQGRQNQ